MKTTPCREAVEPLEVELLVSDHQRRCMLTDAAGRDEIDQAAADPILDHIPQAAPARKVRGLLGILDQLDKEKSNGRFTA